MTTGTRTGQSQLPSETLIENIDDSQAHIALIQQHSAVKTSSGSVPRTTRTPSNLLELKQQRLFAAAERRKRLIARIISIVGLLIILLCAAIVALTLKMAPKIDELVRTRTGGHSSIHLISRMTTLTPSPNVTSNDTLLIRSTSPRSFPS